MANPVLLHSSFSSPAPPSFRRRSPPAALPRKRPSPIIHAFYRDNRNFNYEGKLVDDDMIVLRMRIKDVEKSRVYEPPRGWMGWEKRYFGAKYNSDICEAVGALQSMLMETRPAMVFAMATLLGLSVTTSAALVFFGLLKVFAGVLS